MAAYTQEYLDAVLEQAKEHLPPALYTTLHLAARNRAGGRARHRKPKDEEATYKQAQPINNLGLSAPETLQIVAERGEAARAADGLHP